MSLDLSPVDGWCRLPAGWSFVEVAGVAVDSRDRVFVFNRGEHPVCIFEQDGRFVASWGEGAFKRPHGITIGPDDSVWVTDDLDHTVQKRTPSGELLLTLGTSGRASDTGATSMDYRTIRRAGPPFHYPTNVALSPDGEVYVTDGYGNARVHRFSPEGKLIASWGAPGAGPGEFHCPHGIAIDREGIVHVADRENSRVQRFSPAGEYLGEWTDLARPCQVFIGRDDLVHVAELGWRAGMWPGTSPPTPDATGGCLSVLTREGKLVARLGGGNDPCAPGDFFAPHGICTDSKGAVYVGEVVWSAGGKRGMVPPTCHSLQKLAPRRPAERS